MLSVANILLRMIEERLKCIKAFVQLINTLEVVLHDLGISCKTAHMYVKIEYYTKNDISLDASFNSLQD